jgi:hypothetical protein
LELEVSPHTDSHAAPGCLKSLNHLAWLWDICAHVIFPLLLHCRLSQGRDPVLYIFRSSRVVTQPPRRKGGLARRWSVSKQTTCFTENEKMEERILIAASHILCVAIAINGKGKSTFF